MWRQLSSKKLNRKRYFSPSVLFPDKPPETRSLLQVKFHLHEQLEQPLQEYAYALFLCLKIQALFVSMFHPLLLEIFLIRMVSFPFLDRKSTRLNSSHVAISYAVFCLKKK